MVFVANDRQGPLQDAKHSEVTLSRFLRHERTPSKRASILIKRARLRLRLQQLESAWSDIITLQELRLESERLAILELEADYHLALFESSSVGFANHLALHRAKFIYNSILDLASNEEVSGWIHYQLGRCYALLMDFPSAVQELHQALIMPGNRAHPELTSYCYERLGYITYYEYRNAIEAILYLERSLDTYPHSSDELWRVPVHLLCGRIHRELNAVDDALEATRIALAIATQFRMRALIAESLLLLSDLLANTEGNDQEIIRAIAQYMNFKTRPVDIDLTWARLSDTLGNAYANLCQHDNAIEAYQDALLFNPDHLSEIQIRLKIACCHYRLKQYQQTIDTILNTLASEKRESYKQFEQPLHELLGNAYFSIGDFQSALSAYNSALSAKYLDQAINPNTRAYMTITHNYIKNGILDAKA